MKLKRLNANKRMTWTKEKQNLWAEQREGVYDFMGYCFILFYF